MQVQEQINKLYNINNHIAGGSPLGGEFQTTGGGAIEVSHNEGEKNVGLLMPKQLYYGVGSLTEIIELLSEIREYLKGCSGPEG